MGAENGLWGIIRCQTHAGTRQNVLQTWQRRQQRGRRRRGVNNERPLSLRLWVRSNGSVLSIEHDAGVKVLRGAVLRCVMIIVVLSLECSLPYKVFDAEQDSAYSTKSQQTR